MGRTETIILACAQAAAEVYLRAAGEGLTTPVIGLMALDTKDPGRVEVRAFERQQLAWVLERGSEEASATLREPHAGGHADGGGDDPGRGVGRRAAFATMSVRNADAPDL